MTVLFFLSFPCFQAFSAVSSRPIPPSRPSFVTNLLRQPVSDLFQFYAAFPLPSRLVSILCRILASVLPYSIFCCILASVPPYSIFCCILASVPLYFIFCHILTSVLPYSIFCRILTSVPPYFIFCHILTSVLPYFFFAAFSPPSRLILDFFLLLSVHLQYFQCIFPCSIILSVSPAYTKSIYFIVKYYFKCRFGQAKGTGSPLTENQCPA